MSDTAIIIDIVENVLFFCAASNTLHTKSIVLLAKVTYVFVKAIFRYAGTLLHETEQNYRF